MAWIISATNGRSVAKRHLRFLKAVLLLAHLSLLIFLLRQRSSSQGGGADYAATDLGSDLLAAMPSPATVAVFTGLLLAFAILAGGAAEPSLPRAEAVAPQATPQMHARKDAPEACDAHDGLMARLHHDLRTPLNAIMGFADLMQAETFGPLGNQRYRDYAAHMQACGQDLLRATESTLAMAALMSRPNAVRSENIELVPLIEQCWLAANRGGTVAACAIQIAVPGGLRVRGDQAILSQSLICLFDAALIRCTADSRIEFCARSMHGRINVTLDLHDARARTAVATTGCRPRTGAAPKIDELAIGVSRTLLGLQDATLVETLCTADRWSVAVSLEDAQQSDFFDQPPRSVVTARTPAYSAAFFPALSLPGSRPA